MFQDGICRFNWNLFPSTRLESKCLVTPLGCLYSPFGELDERQVIPESGKHPLVCTSCGNYINPFIKLDRMNRMWWCPFCEKRSPLPSEYTIPSPDALVDDWEQELRQSSTTIDFILPKDISDFIDDDIPYSYLLVLDVYQHTEDINSSPFKTLIENLVDAIENIPLGSLIGLITFDEDVNVYSLANEEKVHFNRESLLKIDLEGDLTKESKIDYQAFFKEDLSSTILKKLQLDNSLKTKWKESSIVDKGYLVELTLDSKTKLINLLRNIKPKLTNTYRPPRASGLAILIESIILSRASFRNFMGKVLFFNGGPCAIEPGSILKNKGNLRSHSDIYEMKAQNYQHASKFYTAISYIANGFKMETALGIANSVSVKVTDFVPNKHSPKWSIDVFGYSLDQVGIYEMKSLSQNTSGNIYLLESPFALKFGELLKESFSPIYSNASLKVDTSSNLKIHRIVSNGCSLSPTYLGKFASFYDSKISDTLNEFDSALSKNYFTNQIAYNSIGGDFSIAVYFEMVTARSSTELRPSGKQEVYIQFLLKYWDLKHKIWKLRVTTLKKPTSLSVYVKNALFMESVTNKRVTKINPNKSGIVKTAFIESFDQEAFVILLTRLLIKKNDTLIGFDKFEDLIKLIDESFVKVLYHFCYEYLKYNNKQDANPFDSSKPLLPKQFVQLPSLLYNLRRNPQFIRIINSSPDETSFNHFWFLRLNCKKSIHTVEPRLYVVNESGLKRIKLDSDSLRYPVGQFLIMDSVLNVVIFYLADDNNKLKLHHTNNDDLIKNNDVSIATPLKLIHQDSPYTKGPITRIHITQTDHSQLRFLLSRLNSLENEAELNMSTLSMSDEPKGGFWSKFRRKVPKHKCNSYGALKTDELNLTQYYKEIISKVYTYNIKDSS